MQTEPRFVKPLLQVAWQTAPCRTRGEMHWLQTVAEEQFWQPEEQGEQLPLLSMNFCPPQKHWLSTDLVKEGRQVVQVVALTQALQFGPQAAQ